LQLSEKSRPVAGNGRETYGDWEEENWDGFGISRRRSKQGPTREKKRERSREKCILKDNRKGAWQVKVNRTIISGLFVQRPGSFCREGKKDQKRGRERGSNRRSHKLQKTKQVAGMSSGICYIHTNKKSKDRARKAIWSQIYLERIGTEQKVDRETGVQREDFERNEASPVGGTAFLGTVSNWRDCSGSLDMYGLG